MKKVALLMLSVLMLSMMLFGCNKNGEESLSLTSSSESSMVSSESSKSADSNASKIKELESEITKLKAELSEKGIENNSLSDNIKSLEHKIKSLEDKIKSSEDEIQSLEDEISALRKPPVRENKTKVKDGVILTLREDYSSNPYYTLSIEYEDKTVVEVIKLWNIWTIKASPKGTKVILNDYDFEVNAKVYMYDVEKRKTRQLPITNLPEQTTVEDMEWLDDRYFLFIVQFDAGTIVRGGDVYIYDTKTDQYKAIVKNTDKKFMTSGFNVYNEDFVVIHSYLYEDTYNFTEDKYHLLTHNEIYDLINNNKTIDLSSIKSFKK